MGLKWFAQFLHKFSNQMSFQECPMPGGHRQGLRLLSEFRILLASLIQSGWRGKVPAAFGNPSVTIAKHPADSLWCGASSHRGIANSEAKSSWCGGIPTLQVFSPAYQFQWLSLPVGRAEQPLKPNDSRPQLLFQARPRLMDFALIPPWTEKLDLTNMHTCHMKL